LKEEAYKVTMELAATQGTFKQIAQETTTNLKTFLTKKMAEDIVRQEAQVRENVPTTNYILQKFLVTWKQT
jgi:ribosomal protein L31E